MERSPYKDMSKEKLKEIYDDVLASDAVPRRVESFVPYAEKIKENIGGDFTLREGIDWARKEFFEEVASRYFKTGSETALHPEFVVNLGDCTSKFKCECGKEIIVHHDSGVMDNNDCPKFCDVCGAKFSWDYEEGAK